MRVLVVTYRWYIQPWRAACSSFCIHLKRDPNKQITELHNCLYGTFMGKGSYLMVLGIGLLTSFVIES